jgi:hypothetical protein
VNRSKTYQTKVNRGSNTTLELLFKHRRDLHALGDGTGVLDQETIQLEQEVEYPVETADLFDWEETADENTVLLDLRKDDPVDPPVQAKLEQEFDVYANHKLELIDQGIDLIPNVKRRPPSKEKKKEKFITHRDKFLKRMEKSEDHSWGTDNYFRLLHNWFPDYTLVLENKVSAIKTGIDQSIKALNQKIDDVIEVLKKAISLADTDIGKALKLIGTTETYITEASTSKDNAAFILSGFSESKTKDFLAQYDTVLELYEQLILSLQANIQYIREDQSSFETVVLRLVHQQEFLADFNLKIQNTSDVLDLIRLQDTDFEDVIRSTEQIIEEANSMERISQTPDEIALLAELDAGKISLGKLHTDLVSVTGGVSSIYPGKGTYYGEEVDALFIVATSYSAARTYTYTRKYGGFWFFVDVATGKTSGIQQRDGFKKYYYMHPVSLEDYNELAAFLNYKFKKDTYTPENLHELFQHETQEFRILVEKTQLSLYGNSDIAGFGLLTTATRKKIKHSNELLIPAKEKFKAPEKTEMKFTPFQKAGLAGDPGKDQKDEKNSGVNLRSEPDTHSDNILEWLPFNTKVYIQSKTNDQLGWYYVTTESGEKGYVSQDLININLPDPDARLYVVREGDTALDLAYKFYSKYSKESLGQVQSMRPDFRNYVDKLAQYNRNTPGIYYKGEKKWDNVHLKAGLRIWVPSPMTMYEMMRATPNSELHGTSSYISLAQDAFDFAPQNLLIHQLLKIWRSIPAEDINKGLQAVDEVSLFILKSLRMNNLEWLDAIVALVSPATFVAMKSLAFMREFTIGYIEHMSSLDAKTRVKSMERFLYSHTQLDYYKGIFDGIGEGLIDWFKDLWGMFKGMYDLIAKLPQYIDQIRAAFGDMADMVIDLIRFLNDPSSADSLTDLIKNFDPMDIFKWIDAGIEKAGQKAGAWAAEKVIGFMNLSPFEAGRKIGWLVGYLIPEVILAIFSFGIGTAVKAGVQAFARAMDLIFRILGKTLKLVINAIKIVVGALDKVIDFVKSIAQFFKRAGKKMSGFFDKLEEFFQKFKEYLKRKEKSPDVDTPDTNTPETDLPNDKDKLPETEEKKTSDVDESKESDKLDESSLDGTEVENFTEYVENGFKINASILDDAFKHVDDVVLNGAGKPTFSSNKLVGCHNEVNFNAQRVSNGGRIEVISETPSGVPGVKNIEYKTLQSDNYGNPILGQYVKNGETHVKTVYDPLVYPEKTMKELGYKSFRDAIDNNRFDISDPITGDNIPRTFQGTANGRTIMGHYKPVNGENIINSWWIIQ